MPLPTPRRLGGLFGLALFGVAASLSAQPVFEESFYVVPPVGVASDALDAAEACASSLAGTLIDAEAYIERSSPELQEVVAACVDDVGVSANFAQQCDLAMANSQVDYVFVVDAQAIDDRWLLEVRALSPARNATVWRQDVLVADESQPILAGRSGCRALGERFAGVDEAEEAGTFTVMPTDQPALAMGTPLPVRDEPPVVAPQDPGTEATEPSSMVPALGTGEATTTAEVPVELVVATPVEPEVIAPLEPLTPAERQRRRGGTFLIGGGVLATTGAAIAAFILPGLNEDVRAWNEDLGVGVNPAEGEDLEDTAWYVNIAASSLIAVGATSAVAGLWMRHRARAQETSVAIAPTAAGATVQLRWRW